MGAPSQQQIEDAAPDTPVPYAPELEDAYLPSEETVIRDLRDLLAY